MALPQRLSASLGWVSNGHRQNAPAGPFRAKDGLRQWMARIGSGDASRQIDQAVLER
jgi:hypothetical protein